MITEYLHTLLFKIWMQNVMLLKSPKHLATVASCLDLSSTVWWSMHGLFSAVVYIANYDMVHPSGIAICTM